MPRILIPLRPILGVLQYVNPKYPNRVCKLQRSIYGLKQASRQWNKRFDEEIKKFGFTQNHDEPCVYRKASGSNVVFLILYVDDILIMGNNIPRLKEVKDYLGKCFSMKDLGEAAYILGIKIYRDRSKRLIGLSQSAYIDKILKKFNMHNSKKGYLPMEVKYELSNEMCASTPEEVAYIKKVPYASAMTKKPFNNNIERATDLLGLIHTDVCGLLRHVSRKEVELQLGKKIKALRSDRGGEYLSQEFKDYLGKNGIVQHLTSPYTPQQNGVSERRNRTLLDMVRSMFNRTTLPLSFWDYALESAVRILNMVPTKKVDKTPYEIWHGKVPNFSYLKVWGCEAYMKRDSADKLQQRSVK
ncbi:retrotransposon protein, putative, ty1-copia subclass, partial [Tanacetum coccineum]